MDKSPGGYSGVLSCNRILIYFYQLGEDDPGFIDSILEGFTSAMDSPVAAVADAIYRAYPNAKFILVKRHSLERSMILLFEPAPDRPRP